jgi:Domain of unknown function (DUF4193)
MPASGAEPEEFEDEHVEEVDEPDEEDLQDDSEAAASTDEEEDGDGSASLDELLAQRAAARRATDEEDDDEILALVSERDEPVRDSINTRVIPIKDRQEFVCKRCHLVKAKSQLTDPQRGLCRDCV